ncbi:hypothetical protein [uncultured Marinobacter sp.]|uniref:hypothetical protein n=1 Tax=uncultured Marinobacter sp. TaxID=187379 RepID=UPI0030DA41BA|tara:strand:+ start:265 stop:741 length:477 start_codon:yes stop_codon:yes gene_type:complete
MSVDVPLDNIRIREIRIQEFPDLNLDLDLGLEGGVALGLDNIQLGITELPALSVGVTELPDVNANLAVTRLPPIELATDNTLKSDNKVDLEVGVAVRKLPRVDIQFGFRPMRFYLPLNYRFCLTLFGHRVLELHSCGEGILISEDNEAGAGAAGSRNP